MYQVEAPWGRDCLFHLCLYSTQPNEIPRCYHTSDRKRALYRISVTPEMSSLKKFYMPDRFESPRRNTGSRGACQIDTFSIFQAEANVSGQAAGNAGDHAVLTLVSSLSLFLAADASSCSVASCFSFSSNWRFRVVTGSPFWVACEETTCYLRNPPRNLFFHQDRKD